MSTQDQRHNPSLVIYTRDLDEWLERGVHDRQNEIRCVYARVEQLGHDIQGMRGTTLLNLL